MQISGSFNHETVMLDGEEFRDCTFQSCRLLYGGGQAPSFDSCRFTDCEWKFEGPAAEALACLKAIWNAGGKADVQVMIKEVTASR